MEFTKYVVVGENSLIFHWLSSILFRGFNIFSWQMTLKSHWSHFLKVFVFSTYFPGQTYTVSPSPALSAAHCMCVWSPPPNRSTTIISPALACPPGSFPDPSAYCWGGLQLRGGGDEGHDELCITEIHQVATWRDYMASGLINEAESALWDSRFAPA